MSMIAVLQISKIFTHFKRLINSKDKRFGLVTSYDIKCSEFRCYLQVTPIDEQRLVGV